jgi:hypothetical protein
MVTPAVCLGRLCAGGGRVARGWSRILRGRGIDAWTHQKKQIHKKDDDEDEAADEDVRPEPHHGLVSGKIGRRDVFVLVVAFVVMFVHAHKLTLQMVAACCMAKKYFAAGGLGCDDELRLNRCLHAWLYDLRCGMLVRHFRDDLGLSGFDKDQSCDQNDRDGHDKGDDDRLDGRVTDALFRGGVASSRLLFAH